MARRLELKVINLGNGVNGEAIQFSYGAVMLNALRFANPQEGLVLDQVLRAVEAQQPLTKAMDEKADHVVFSEDQWKLICEKIDKFPFAIATQEIAEFGLHVRNAPEMGTEKKVEKAA